jgi:CheY-like chemotaxis protein
VAADTGCRRCHHRRGIELRDALSCKPEPADIPVIVLSATDSQYELSNVEAYIRKPMDPDELVRVVDQACGRVL